MNRRTVAAFLAMAFLATGTAAAHRDTAHGEVVVVVVVEPIANCVFVVHAEGLDHDEGEYLILKRFGEDDNNPPQQVANGTWEADDDGSVTLGPFTLEHGGLVQAYLVMGLNETTGVFEHSTSSEPTRVECVDEPDLVVEDKGDCIFTAHIFSRDITEGTFEIEATFAGEDEPTEIDAGEWVTEDGVVMLGPYTLEAAADVQLTIDADGETLQSEVVAVACEETEIPFFPTSAGLVIAVGAVVGIAAIALRRR